MPLHSSWHHCNELINGQPVLWSLMRIPLWHDEVVKWEHFPRYWPFVGGIHRGRSPVNSPHKGQRSGTLMFSLICVWMNDWVSNREAGDLRRYRANYDIIVMLCHEMPNVWVQYRYYHCDMDRNFHEKVIIKLCYLCSKNRVLMKSLDSIPLMILLSSRNENQVVFDNTKYVYKIFHLVFISFGVSFYFIALVAYIITILCHSRGPFY